MKAIHASPKSVHKILDQTAYIIPEFQRSYSWTPEKCEKLWEDVVSFFDSEEKGNYFLGTITIYPSEKNDGDGNSIYEVIDGQQRLITLLLLIRILYQKSIGSKANLGKYLRSSYNLITGEESNEPKMRSKVLGGKDNEYITRLCCEQGDLHFEDRKNLFTKNYITLREQVNDWLAQNGGAQFQKLIGAILTQVVMLPIYCEDLDDSLTTFETLNDRGMPLNDADIFKVKLYKSAKEKGAEKEFDQRWSDLENHTDLFRIYMHILRAKDEKIEKEIGLRKYFDQPQRKKEVFGDWFKIMESITKINNIREKIWVMPPDIDKLWYVLASIPNGYWRYPLYVFLDKHNRSKADANQMSLSDSKKREYQTLIEETVRYFLYKGVVHKNVNKVKDTIFKVCENIEAGKDYKSLYRKNIETEAQNFDLENIALGRYDRFVIYLASCLNPKQNNNDLCKLLASGMDIEHILPKKWHHYDGYTKDNHGEYCGKLGNLMPLESKVNIAASNDFYFRKQEHYKESLIQDALELTQTKSAQWLPENINNRTKVLCKRIADFLKG